MMNVTLNSDQRLYIIPCGTGCSCLGFDVVYDTLLTLREKLVTHLKKTGREPAPVLEAEIGTLDQYKQYQGWWDLAAKEKVKLGTWFKRTTPPHVRRILETYRETGKWLRLFYGDASTGRDWLEENDVLGRIGRSMGPQKVPLLVEPGECGGCAILDDCIVRILDVATGRELYRHPQYHYGTMEIHAATCREGYTHGVWVNGQNHANFRSLETAAHWIAFMTGHSMIQP
jgi:hypothetical protein